MKLLPQQPLKRLLGDDIKLEALYIDRGSQENGQAPTLHVFYKVEKKVKGKEVVMSEGIVLLSNTEYLNYVTFANYILQRFKQIERAMK